MNLWEEHLPPECLVVLSGRDVLMAPQEVRLWLHWQSTAAVMYNPNLAHAGFLLDLKWQRAIIRRLLALKGKRSKSRSKRMSGSGGSATGVLVGQQRMDRCNSRHHHHQRQLQEEKLQGLAAPTAAAAADDDNDSDEEWHDAAAEAKAVARVSLEDARRGPGGQMWLERDLERALVGHRGASLHLEPGEIAAVRAAGPLLMKPNLLQPITLPSSFASPSSQRVQRKQQEEQGGAVAGLRVPVKPAPAPAVLSQDRAAAAGGAKEGEDVEPVVRPVAAAAGHSGVAGVGAGVANGGTEEQLLGLVKQYPGVQLQLQKMLPRKVASAGRLGSAPAGRNGGEGGLDLGLQLKGARQTGSTGSPAADAAPGSDSGHEGLGRDLQQLAQGRHGIFGSRFAASGVEGEAEESGNGEGGPGEQGSGSAGSSRQGSGSLASARESWQGSEGGDEGRKRAMGLEGGIMYAQSGAGGEEGGSGQGGEGAVGGVSRGGGRKLDGAVVAGHLREGSEAWFGGPGSPKVSQGGAAPPPWES